MGSLGSGDQMGKMGAAARPRVMRVFVSSTFRDMQAERDELVKFVFPQLRKACEQRGVIWADVDLRWGITDEQKAEGRVLPICLREIQRCRPYFIGILGDRYGWIPDEIPQDLIEQEPWLAQYRLHSVTELEILHGVLNNPDMAEHAFFYFRDPQYLSTLPASQQPAYREEPTAEELREYGREEAEHRAEGRRQKLISLKQRICQSGFPVKQGYSTPRQLGEWVLRDLTGVIEELYPPGSAPDPLDREAAEHEHFAQSLAQVYVARRSYFDQLDQHACSQAQPLVVLGESGSGKSALLANWALRYREQHPDSLVLTHFIGCTPGSTDWMAMLRRIMGELKRRYDIRDEIPDRPDALRRALANWLNMVATRGQVILVLDGLNQLDSRDGSPHLAWLPQHIPANVRMLVSTLAGPMRDELLRRGWPLLSVEPLDQDECKQLIREYLAISTKALRPELAERISSAPQCRNPLFLSVLLAELRVFGSHERLSDQIEHYLDARDIPALYALVLERCEQDFERDRPGLVRDSLAALWSARRGLSEVELLDLLGSQGQPLPAAHWSPLSLALEQALLSRGGLIGFAHDHMRRAVQERYLPTIESQHSEHRRLAHYFKVHDLDRRTIDELPWQLAQGEEWKQLYDVLAAPDFFLAAWDANEFDVRSSWAQLRERSDLKMADAYGRVLDHPEQYAPHLVWEIARLMNDAGYPLAASSLNAYLIEHFRLTANLSMLVAVLGMQANINYHLGRLDEALKLHEAEEDVCRALDARGGLALALVNQGPILVERGDTNAALARYQEAEPLFRELGDARGLAKSLTGQAIILTERGELQQALALHQESEQLCRTIANQDELVVALVNQGNTRFRQGDLQEAGRLYEEAEGICRHMGNREWLAKALGNQANIRYHHGDLVGAMRLYQEVRDLCIELGNRNDQQIMLHNQARILEERGEIEHALDLYREEEHLCREMGNRPGLQESLRCQAALLDGVSSPADILAVQRENERLCRELGNQRELAVCLIHQAVVLALRMNDRYTAVPLADEAYQLAVACGDVTLANQINTLRRQLG